MGRAHLSLLVVFGILAAAVIVALASSQGDNGGDPEAQGMMACTLPTPMLGHSDVAPAECAEVANDGPPSRTLVLELHVSNSTSASVRIEGRWWKELASEEISLGMDDETVRTVGVRERTLLVLTSEGGSPRYFAGDLVARVILAGGAQGNYGFNVSGVGAVGILHFPAAPCAFWSETLGESVIHGPLTTGAPANGTLVIGLGAAEGEPRESCPALTLTLRNRGLWRFADDSAMLPVANSPGG